MEKKSQNISQNQNQSKGAYTKINRQVRQALIYKTIQLRLTIAQASRQLNLNQSTAKMIVKKFKEEGIIFQKKQDKLRREILKKQRIRLQNEDNQVQFGENLQFPQICWFLPMWNYPTSYPWNSQ